MSDSHTNSMDLGELALIELATVPRGGVDLRLL